MAGERADISFLQLCTQCFHSCACSLRSCENAIGIMTQLQSSLVTEETWVDGATEKLSALPTATSAMELDVSIAPQTQSSIDDTQQNNAEIALRSPNNSNNNFFTIVTELQANTFRIDFGLFTNDAVIYLLCSAAHLQNSNWQTETFSSNLSTSTSQLHIDHFIPSTHQIASHRLRSYNVSSSHLAPSPKSCFLFYISYICCLRLQLSF